MRKLVSIRTIAGVEPIPKADAIELVLVDGWKIVSKKGDFKEGDKCVYFEIDSFLPDGNPAWQFLVDKSARIFEGVKGHKLRTIKLRGQVSQGLALPLSALPGISTDEDVDLAESLGVKKWEAALPACLAGQAAGLFPSFLRKTDQERAQNIVPQIFGYDTTLSPIDVAVELLSAEAIASGRIKVIDGVGYAVREAKASRDDEYEVSIKLDGSSLTAFAHRPNPEEPVIVGVCSRNLELKINEENSANTFVKTATETGLLKALEAMANAGRYYAVQGELMGVGIQGNQEMLQGHEFFVFDIFDIAESRYLLPIERCQVFTELIARGAEKILHVPVLFDGIKLPSLGITNLAELLAFADGPSLHAKKREGLVYKSTKSEFSFKTISNDWLLTSDSDA